MASTTSGAILTAWKARLDAMVPAQRAGPDDKYQVVIGLRSNYMGSRGILLTASPGRRVQGGRTCSDWEVQVLVEAFYLDNAGAYVQACDDAEQICNDLYDWVASNDGQTMGLLRVEPDLASIVGQDGELMVSRSARILYRGLS